jgi:hypothetical protein
MGRQCPTFRHRGHRAPPPIAGTSPANAFVPMLCVMREHLARGGNPRAILFNVE